MHIHDIVNFITENRDALITFMVSLIAILRLTAWGRAQTAALDAVVGVIEVLGARSVKAGVSDVADSLPTDAQDALTDSVAKADPKKDAPGLFVRLLKFVF
ncbi:MAG: hypothetical protein ACYC27_22305 [Armatimonadota bacterium]